MSRFRWLQPLNLCLLLLATLFLGLSPLSARTESPFFTSPPQGELSEAFASWYEKEAISFTPEEKLRLKEYFYLFIPGFLSDFTIKATPVGYYKETLSFLHDELGLEPTVDYRRLVIKSQSRSEKNSSLIAKAISDTSKKVVIFGHSKGATDTLAMLAGHQDIWPKIHAFIPIQAPFHGTPLIEQIISYRVLRWAFMGITKGLGGEMESFLEFSPHAHENDPTLTTEQISHFPFKVFTFVSYLRPGEKMSIPLLRPFHNALSKREGFNDGLVPTLSGLLPGVPAIIYGGIDHTDPTISWGKRGKKKHFMGALLKVLLSLEESATTL